MIWFFDLTYADFAWCVALAASGSAVITFILTQIWE